MPLPFKVCRWFLAIWIGLASAQAARLEVVPIPGITLRDNPLGDPAERPVAVFSPEGSEQETKLPMVIYLPGWGGGSQDAIAQGNSSIVAQAVDRLAAIGKGVRVAVVDGRSHYGGSQFLNSGATGRYADYVAKEIQPELLRQFPSLADQPRSCVIAGHSSGGYGALMRAMAEHQKFYGVVALSPDSDFEVTHKPLVQQESVRAVTRAELDAAMSPTGQARLPADGLARLVVGLCANYTPLAGQPGKFAWLYDDQGQWRPEVWQRWIAQDPLTMVQKHADAFAPKQRVYLDGAEHDEFGANIGARKIYETLKPRGAAVTFHEPAGGHGEHLPERLARGLQWVLTPGAAE